MKKLALVLVVLTLGALCSAQTYTFGFASVGGGLYCNYEQISISSGLVAGGDNLSPCGISISSTVSGFAAAAKPNATGAHGAGVVYGDAIYQGLGYATYNAMWGVFSKLKCNKQDKFGNYHGSLGWAGNAAFSTFELGTNQGFLSCSIPGRNGNAPTKGSTIVAKQ